MQNSYELTIRILRQRPKALSLVALTLHFPENLWHAEDAVEDAIDTEVNLNL